MTHFSLINPQACVEIGRSDFAAAAEAGRIRRMQEHRQERTKRDRVLTAAEEQFRAAFRERFDDIGETGLALDAAHDLAELARAFAAQAAPILQRIRNVERLLVDEGDFADEAGDLLTEQLSADPLARDLSRVVSAALKAGVQ